MLDSSSDMALVVNKLTAQLKSLDEERCEAERRRRSTARELQTARVIVSKLHTQLSRLQVSVGIFLAIRIVNGGTSNGILEPIMGECCASESLPLSLLSALCVVTALARPCQE